MPRGPKRFGASRGRLTVAKTLGADLFLRFDPGAEAVAEEWKSRLERLENLQPVLDDFGAYLVNEHIPTQFRVRGKPKRWAPLDPVYAQYKRRRYGRLPILVISGRMREGFSWVARTRSLQVTNRTPYWFHHQFGTSRMPARPMLQVREKDRRVLRRMIIVHGWGAAR